MNFNGKLSLRNWIYLHLDGKSNDIYGIYIQYILMAIININIIAVILESVDDISSKYTIVFQNIEYISLIVFSIEYLLRIWSCVEDPKYSHPITGRIKYFISPLALIDIMAIMPGLLSIGSIKSMDMRILRIIRLFRILRILKLVDILNQCRLLFLYLEIKKSH